MCVHNIIYTIVCMLICVCVCMHTLHKLHVSMYASMCCCEL